MLVLVKFKELPIYKDIWVSKQMKAVISRQGLIEPLTIMPDGNIYEYDRERYMAFRNLAEGLGEGGTDTIIAVYLTDLSEEEKLDI